MSSNSNKRSAALQTVTSGRSSREIVKVQGKEARVGNLNDWRGIVATFISAQDVKASSRDLYARTLSQFFVWIQRNGKVLINLTRQDILEYKDTLLSYGLSSLTVCSYITAVKKFYAWAEGEKIYPNIAKGVSTPRRKQAFKKQHLTDAKSSELLDHFKSTSLRDYAIVNLILRTGLRTVEIVRANVEDITFKRDKRVLVVWGKGHEEKDDYVVLSEKAYEPIREYLQTRKAVKGGEPLFTSSSHQNYGGRLTTRTISAICKDGLRAIGLDGKEFTAHSLRHTTGCAMLSHGASLVDVQHALRHRDPRTTEIYLESIDEEQRLEKAPTLLLDNAF